jgi:HlyD family secretion protein
MKESLRRRLLPVTLGVAAIAGLVWLLRPEPVRVEVGEVERGPLAVTVDEEGRTRVRQRFVVAAPVSGRLQRVVLEEGDPVDGADVVARIEVAPLDPRVRAEAQANVKRAEAALAQARRAHRRAEELARAGAISESEREMVELDEITREKELEAARAALLAAQDEQAGGSGRDGIVEVRSPAAGRTLRVLEESERVVVAGTPLLEIGDAANLEVVVDVLSEDAVRIPPEAEVRIVEWGGEGELAGRVRRVEPSGFTKVSALGVEEQRVNVLLDLVDPPPSLGDGYRVEARIVVWKSEDVLSAPASALFRCGPQGWCAFVLEGGRATRREVELGQRGARRAEVVRGLAAGDRVILHPSDRVAEGVRVVAIE